MRDSAFGYFITACFVILIAIISYLVLPRMVSALHSLALSFRLPGLRRFSRRCCCVRRRQEFFRYYVESSASRSAGDDENRMDLLKQGTCTPRPFPFTRPPVRLHASEAFACAAENAERFPVASPTEDRGGAASVSVLKIFRKVKK